MRSSILTPSFARHSAAVSWRQLALWLIPGLLLVLYYERSAWQAAGTLGFPLDDAWIHAQFARNLATGHGFTYTGDRWVAGSTSPAWTVLLAFGYLVTRSTLIAATILGVALQFACGVLAARLVLVLTANPALAVTGGLVTVTSPAMVWGAVSGMELGLASALVLGGFGRYLTAEDRLRPQLGGIALLALACLARPEALVLLALVALHLVAGARTPAACLRRLAGVVLVSVAVLGPVVLFDYLTTGKPLPTTFYAKSGPGLLRVVADGNGVLTRRLFVTHGPDAVWKFGETLVDQFGAGAFVMIFGLAAAFTRSLRQRGAALIAVGVVVGSFSMGLVVPMRLKPENFRYTAQLVSLAAVLGVASLSVVWPLLLRRRTVQVAVLAGLVSLGCYQSVLGARTYAGSVRTIQQLHVTLAEWMRTHLPPGSTVAVNDIGALAYFGGHQVIDLEGLVSPEALAYARPERGIGFARATRPDFIAIFPHWYPDISGRPDLFREVYRVSISDNYVSAGDTVIVYSTPWTRYPPVLHPPAGPRRWRWPA